jgi:hypothetical protein
VEGRLPECFSLKKVGTDEDIRVFGTSENDWYSDYSESDEEDSDDSSEDSDSEEDLANLPSRYTY